MAQASVDHDTVLGQLRNQYFNGFKTTNVEICDLTAFFISTS